MDRLVKKFVTDEHNQREESQLKMAVMAQNKHINLCTALEMKKSLTLTTALLVSLLHLH